MQQPAARRCCRSAQGSVGFALSDWTVWSSSWYGRGRDLCGSRWPLLFQHILGSFCILNNILYVTRVFMYFGISYDTKYLIKRCLIPPVSISSNFSHTPKASATALLGTPPLSHGARVALAGGRGAAPSRHRTSPRSFRGSAQAIPRGRCEATRSIHRPPRRRGRAVPLPSRRAGRAGELRRRPAFSGRGRKRLGQAARGGGSPARGDDAAPVRGPQRRAGRHGLPAALPAGARPPRPGPAVRGRRAGAARAAGGAGRAARRAGGRARQEQGAGGRASGSGAGSRAAGRGEGRPRSAGLRKRARPSWPRSLGAERGPE